MAEYYWEIEDEEILPGDLVQYQRVSFPFRVDRVFREHQTLRAHVENEDPQEMYFLDLDSVKLLKRGESG